MLKSSMYGKKTPNKQQVPFSRPLGVNTFKQEAC
jgi:hypothetical protein